MEWLDVVLRLVVATAIGGAIGLNRELHGKPSGLRTLGLVSLGAALVVLTTVHVGGVPDPHSASRVIQGVITGIGFLGAGVILRSPEGGRVRGITTAAAIWVTACVGVACGYGVWRLVLPAAIIIAFLLVAGGPLEDAIVRRFLGQSDQEPPKD
jgi:putative Mg2+ transporter-C (MgtC) family protein